MTCENFREQLHILLDKKSITSLSEEMLNHKRICKDCDGYVNSILSIHEQLFRITRVKPSATLMNRLMSIGSKTQMIPVLPSWKYDVKRALILLGPLLLMFISNYLPTLVSTLINLGILTAGLVFALTTILKPIFFHRY